ncbi:MAG: amino acid ABC transporter substrate-binding protein [Cardiobacteriaceae bacterium]|nr:amino acid ABC transporter substrate-binding protein [Cardiobacteriaceae bacterium]
MKSSFLKRSAIALLMGSFIQMAIAQTSLLDSIKQKGEITIGHGEMTIPFTYILPDETIPRGFSHDIELVIVEHLKKVLNLPNLKVNYQQVTYENLFDLVLKGNVQLYCGTTTNTVERQKEMSFSNAFFVASTRLMVRKDSGIKSLKDLKDKRVGTMQDSNSSTFIRSRKISIGIKEVRAFNREDEAVAALQSGELQGFFMSDGTLAGIMAQMDNPDEWELVGKPATSQRFGCFSRLDPQLKALTDEALANFYASGEIYKLYDKWFKEPIAPYNRAIGFEMSTETKRIYEAPTDKAIGQP